jgi:hypothetical protein
MTAFVVPCKFDPARPIVFDCVASIRLHHPDATIVVVDANSDDRSYLTDVDADLIGDFATGPTYTLATYKWAYDQLPDEQTFGLIHDSLIVNAPIPDPDPLLTVRHFCTPPQGWGWDSQGVPLQDWAAQVAPFPIPDQFVGILGPMWFCRRQVLADLVDFGLFDIPVLDKWQLCGMERVTGIALQACGYDPTVSLQGEMFGFFDHYDETVVSKCHLGRY